MGAASSISLRLADAARCSTWLRLRDATGSEVDAFLMPPGCLSECYQPRLMMADETDWLMAIAV